MWPLLFVGIRRYLQLLFQALSSPFDSGRSLLGAVLVILGFPLLVLWQALHWLGFLLDEVLFRRYRKVEVRDPLFIIGPPRTGTTFLHHVLASDPEYTTFRTWECLFGLSISARRLFLGLVRLDRAIGRPFGRIRAIVGRYLVRSMDDIHPLDLAEPEEDFLCLMPFAACFLLIVPFPRAHWLWQVARLDDELDEREKAAVMLWYRRCIQKHLYVHGPERRFLSKNASFCGLTQTLLETFPDARVLVTWRDPLATVPSQLSSLKPGLAACGFAEVSEELRSNLTNLMLYYYLHIAAVEDDNPERVVTIRNEDLRTDLDNAIRRAFASIGLEVGESLDAGLKAMAAESRRSSSSHKYALEDFGLDENLIRSQFAAVYEREQALEPS